MHPLTLRHARSWLAWPILALVLAASPGGAAARRVAPAVPDGARINEALVQVAPGEQPIRLTDVRLHAEVDGSLARSVLEMAFVNPNPRVLEGELQLPLHAGQTVTAFALEMADGSMRDAVAVPRARGREVFEQIARRGVDPALLEQVAGERFRLRLYPLRPGVARRVRVEITEWLPAGAAPRALVLPLDFGDTEAQSLSVQVQLHGVDAAAVRLGPGLAGAQVQQQGVDGAQALLERRPFRLSPGQGQSASLHWKAAVADVVQVGHGDGQDWFRAEVAAPGASVARTRPDEIAIVWDASGSGAGRDHAREFALLDALFAWQPDVSVRLRVVRDAAEPERRYEVRRGHWSGLRALLQQVAYDGASNASLWGPETPLTAGHGLVLLFSDGLANWGEPAAPAREDGTPSFAIQAGAGGAETLRQWAEARGGARIDLAAADASHALRAIRLCGSRLLRVTGSGFDQVLPASRNADDGRLELAGRLTAPEARIELVLQSADGQEHHRRLVVRRSGAADDSAPGAVARRWAGLRVAELQSAPGLHASEIEALGRRFGIVTPGTSLIVLETLDDYQRYGIEPPAGPMRVEWKQARQQLLATQAGDSQRHLADLARRFAEMQSWWQTDFSRAADLVASGDTGRQGPVAQVAAAPLPARSPMDAQAMALQSAAPAAAAPRREGSVRIKAMIGPTPASPAAPEAPAIRISLQAQPAEVGGQQRLAAAPPSQRYRVYLDERRTAERRPAFYLDAAEVFRANGDHRLALRVLSNLAELDFDNRALLRILGYRLQEMGETAEAVRVLQRVCVLAPDEPQSWRDLGLAQAAAGAWQAAVDALWKTAAGDWSDRFPDIDLIALNELDAIAALHPGLDLSAIDPRLRQNLPLDLRVVLAWDSDNVDLDLWVKDPQGEWVSYRHPAGRQGGRLSHDNTGGYGPEVYSLRYARPGQYEVRAKYFASRQQVLGATPTLMLRLVTGFGTPAQSQREVILRLRDVKDDILVGSFEVTPPLRP